MTKSFVIETFCFGKYPDGGDRDSAWDPDLQKILYGIRIREILEIITLHISKSTDLINFDTKNF